MQGDKYYLLNTEQIKCVGGGTGHWLLPACDGAQQMGIKRQYVGLSSNQYSGSTSITLPVSGAKSISNNVVVDKTTGLMWSKNKSPVVLEWDAHCDALDFDGKAGPSFIQGNHIIDGSSGAIGVIRYILNNGDGTGTLYLETVTGTFGDNNTITEYEPDASPTGATAVVDGTITAGSKEDVWKYLELLNEAEYAGHHDWRLPNAFELLTLLTFARIPTGGSHPDTAYFEDMSSNIRILSSSTFVQDTDYFYGSSFQSGTIGANSINKYTFKPAQQLVDYYTLVVRGPITNFGVRQCLCLPTGQITQYAGFADDGFYQNLSRRTRNFLALSTGDYSGSISFSLGTMSESISNNCVLDQDTQLMWTKEVNDNLLHWANDDNVDSSNPTRQDIWAFLRQVNIEQLGGHRDWRIPNVFEVMSIIDLSTGNPYSAYFSSASTGVWTGTTSPNGAASALRFSSAYGGVVSNTKSQSVNVRLVRGGIRDATIYRSRTI